MADMHICTVILQLTCIYVTINQSSIPERNKQVPLMRDIYWNAQQCIIDLGEEQEGSAPAFERAMTIDEELRRNVGDAEGGNGEPEFSRVEFAGICYLFSRPWFSRIWVFQEAVLAVDVSILYGLRSITWGQLCTLALSFDRYFTERPDAWAVYYSLDNLQPAHLEPLQIALPLFLTMAELRRAGNAVPPRRITKLLRKTLPMAATDPRDKIYGLLGLATGKMSFDIQPDYATPTATVYREFARTVLKHGDMRILSDAGNNNHSIAGLPSWTPDWTAWSYKPFVSVSVYRACGARKKIQLVSSPTNPNTIYIVGGIVDTVQFVSKSLPRGKRTPLKRVVNVRFQRRALVERLDSYPTGEDIFEAYWRTLLYDRIEDSDGFAVKAPPEYGGYYQDYLRCCELVQEDPFVELPTDLQQHLLIYVVEAGERFCVTQNGYMGNVPPSTLPGDKICVLYGARVPFVLREEGASYRIIGDCYIHGLMDGEAFQLKHWKEKMISIC